MVWIRTIIMMTCLQIITLEDKHYHVSASTRGFFINHTTEEEFNPKMASPRYSIIIRRNISIVLTCISLVISPTL